MLVENFKLENWIAKYESITEYDLSQTCVQNLTIKELEQICDCEIDLKNIQLGYGELYGSNKLKQAICNLYDKKTPQNITVTLGGIGANELALKTFINKDDKVVCVTPCYQQIYSIPKFYGANVVFTDFQNLEKNSENAKIICINNPNNPLGTVLTETEINLIINTARKNNSFIFADEAYRGLPDTKSFADIYEKTIVTGSMSKVYSLAGIRLGWICADENFINKVNQNRQYNTISISALDDKVSTIALNNREKLINRNLKIIKNNKKLVDDFLKKADFKWLKEPVDCAIGCVKYKSNKNSVEFCEQLVKNTGILLIPASVFECENFFRIGFGMDETYLKYALEKFINYII